MDRVINYFNGDTMASDSWRGKYQMKNKQGEPLEEIPSDMHRRLANEFAKTEYQYKQQENDSIRDFGLFNLSKFGQELFKKRVHQSQQEIADELFSYFDHFGQIIPQGSIMSNLGNPFVFGSLSNCFVISSPEDSYGGIMRADQELVQLMKRRGGVGTTLDFLRPVDTIVTNAARTSTGVPSFAERYSNSTREVGQDGRRGALMLLLSVKHPDIFKWINIKEDRTKVTGANISVMFSDEFMYAVEADEDFVCTFPVDADISMFKDLEDSITQYNNVVTIQFGKDGPPIKAMKVRAKEIWSQFSQMAWSNAEPGAAYIDRVQNYSPDGVYQRFKPTKCNPCGEIWMSDYDACRLIAQNLLACVRHPFTEEAVIDLSLVYEISYIQQRISDSLIDLEAQYIDRIIDKILADPESLETKHVEITLWRKIKETTLAGRRTGNGITALGDMLAALNFKYDSDIALEAIKAVMKTKMQAELDCTIDLAILRGPFEGWDRHLEFEWIETTNENMVFTGKNDFFQMIKDEFPEQARRMFQYGRRNVSWSTVAPTGTVSLMSQTTSGLEPLFKAYYIRRKKINPGDTNVRVDFVDQNNDSWQEYPILHPKFKEWILSRSWASMDNVEGFNIDYMSKQLVQNLFEKSPWYGSEADNISWEKRIKIQAIIQKYTSNAISSTINLPSDVPVETVENIYFEAWKQGLKGVTVYRDGSRTGVLVTDTKVTKDEFGYTNAVKRPKELDADYYCMTSRGKQYAIIVGKLNGNPYEIFAFEDPLCKDELSGKIIKERKGTYVFESLHTRIDNLQLTSEHSDEALLTRWVSLLLRHGADPRYIADQVSKSEVQVTSFANVIARVLKKYIPDQATGEACTQCGEYTMIYEEGCKKCISCGHSKC
jgi:ribonucleoside-diphosphate reductase alpha chain